MHFHKCKPTILRKIQIFLFHLSFRILSSPWNRKHFPQSPYQNNLHNKTTKTGFLLLIGSRIVSASAVHFRANLSARNSCELEPCPVLFRTETFFNIFKIQGCQTSRETSEWPAIVLVSSDGGNKICIQILGQKVPPEGHARWEGKYTE